MADSGGHILGIFWFLVVFLVMQVYGDGCTTYSVLSGQIRRSSAYNVTPSDTAICDNFLTEQWYRIDSLAGNEIVRTCPAMTQCGTVFPLWMDGDLPIPTEGVVNRTVCKSGLAGCCEETLKIKVKNCVTYYVYLLKPASGCSSAYCFGTLLVSENTTSSAATTDNSTASQTSKTTNTSVTSPETAITNSEGDTTGTSISPRERKHKGHTKQKEDHVLLIIIVVILIILGAGSIIAVLVVICRLYKDSNHIQHNDCEKPPELSLQIIEPPHKKPELPLQIVEPTHENQPELPLQITSYKELQRIKPCKKRIR